MFDVGFSELVLIGIVALIVVGPERLPKVARTAGLLLGRARRYVENVKAEIDREIHLDEFRQLQNEVVQSARELENSLRQEGREIASEIELETDLERESETDSARLAPDETAQETSAPPSAPSPNKSAV
ncbi:MAG: Sec-independent protein translocase protein TatB [Zoogloeaceae bacterium]|jgi:sec-independent protein translocase protein TatB|nr:Sec-independent protein translocase protein TatB [Zoogloeaceae bacterium]